MNQENSLDLNQRMAIIFSDCQLQGLTFVEASPSDRIWGVGLSQDDPKIENDKNWKGQNLLGKVMTEARAEILKRLSGHC